MEENKNTNTQEVEVQTTETAAEATAEKTFTQKEVDELINKRLMREQKKHQKELEATKTTSETNYEEENSKLKETLKGLNKKILNYEAHKVASALNVKQERIDAFLKLADMSNIELDDQDTYKDEIKELLTAVANDYPEFLTKKEETKQTQGKIKVGTENKTQVTEEDKLRKQIFAGFGL